MEKQFCSYEIALKLKELGFDEECFAYFHPDSDFCMFEYYDLERQNSTIQSDYGGIKQCTAPLWQQTIVFLLKKLEDIDFLASIRVFSDQSGDIVLYKGKKEISFDTLEECANAVIEILTEQNQSK